jgi:hypothetical protein
MGAWAVIRLDNTKLCRFFYGLLHLGSSSAQEEVD